MRDEQYEQNGHHSCHYHTSIGLYRDYFVSKTLTPYTATASLSGFGRDDGKTKEGQRCLICAGGVKRKKFLSPNTVAVVTCAVATGSPLIHRFVNIVGNS